MENLNNEFVNRYKILSIIGKGESCIVRNAYDEQTRSHVALKFIDLSNEAKFKKMKKSIIQSTEMEIEMLKICRGIPNIVQLKDFFLIDAYYVLSFERYSIDLFEYMNQKVTIDEWLTSKLTYQLLSALSFLHTSRIIHRDIKAENIMLSSNMDLHLSDFGVSVFWEGDEKFDEITGTIGYMAPEMLLISLKPDDKSLKYHKEIDFLIGYPPFWNDDQLKLIKLIVDQDYNQKLFRYKYISSEAKNIIDSLLVKNPRMRATVSEVVDSKFCKIHQMKSRELYLNETGMNDDFDINTLLTVENPYSLSIIRNIVDSCSFSIYNHWVSEDNVKKHRASLYQTDNFTE